MIFNSEKYRHVTQVETHGGCFGKRVRFQDIPQHCTRAARSVDSSFISYNGARSQPVSRGFSASCLHRAGHAGRAQILGRRAPRPEGTHLRDPPPGKLFPFPNKRKSQPTQQSSTPFSSLHGRAGERLAAPPYLKLKTFAPSLTAGSDPGH